MLVFNCKLMKNGVLAIQLVVFCTIISYGLCEEPATPIISASKAKLKEEMFLKGIGGIRELFLAGILMIGVPSLTSNSSFIQTICGISVLQRIGITTGMVFSSWIVRLPVIV